ncbi:hypothetical protein H310_04407 [Aphanomyces invadans]|uniref:Uncharacterized protein n=1 Tax=Aphanomyces invadans TaxID=157072 RepID=A0A024UDP7_9STRA|nr:hypothetical protein H310_04407 [Aphanomyces invadans]ETW04002.1 hypothetical protein H310_04407 [Aphanomyces invadans]|eukprot:XP_008866958.1 hypothetical protein H310_04407 [Aphanomyces invadans]
MADKLASELQLPNVSALQLQELKWTTKEKIWLQLVHKNPSSSEAYERVKALSDDRKQARAVEKAEDLPKETLRKSEDSYRADFMKVIETELARIGAPSMITWQRLVLDKDCNYQAMRIVLTKIKSSQKKVRAQSVLPVIELKPTPPQPGRTDTSTILFSSNSSHSRGELATPSSDSAFHATSFSRGSSNRRSAAKPSSPEHPETNSPPLSPDDMLKAHNTRLLPSTDTAPRPSWNSDCTDLAQRDASPSMPSLPYMKRHLSSSSDGRQPPRQFPDASAFPTMSSTPEIQPSSHEGPAKQTSATTQKLKAALAENAALKKKMEDLMALHDAAMDASPDGKGSVPSTRRVRLLQAQNLQLQRQVDMLTEAVHMRQHSHDDLAHVVSSLVAIVQEGEKDAAAAGADQSKGKPDKWMFAVPSALLAELKLVESRLGQLQRKCSMELPLRYNADVMHDRNAVLLSDIHDHHASIGPEHVPQLTHLRFDRLHALETALSECVRRLDSLTLALMDRKDNGDLAAVTSPLATATRAVVEEVALFGSAVCHHPVGPGTKLTSEPRAQDIVQLVPKKDKVLTMHLNRLAMYEAGRDVQLKSITTELAGYKHRAAAHAELTARLVDGVRGIGMEKLAWVQQTLRPALHGLGQVYDHMKAASDIPKGWATLFRDTFEQHVHTLSRVELDFQQYTKTVNAKLDNTLEALIASSS